MLSDLRKRFEGERSADPLPEERLKEMKFSLLSTLRILGCFFREVVPESSRGSYRQVEEACRIGVETCISDQAKLLRCAKAAGDQNRLSSALYFDEWMELTKSRGENSGTGEAAVVHKGCLCLRPSYLHPLCDTYGPPDIFDVR